MSRVYPASLRLNTEFFHNYHPLIFHLPSAGNAWELHAGAERAARSSQHRIALPCGLGCRGCHLAPGCWLPLTRLLNHGLRRAWIKPAASQYQNRPPPDTRLVCFLKAILPQTWRPAACPAASPFPHTPPYRPGISPHCLAFRADTRPCFLLSTFTLVPCSAGVWSRNGTQAHPPVFLAIEPAESLLGCTRGPMLQPATCRGKQTH